MNDEKEILEGFNAGYIIRSKKPELFDQLKSQFEDLKIPFFTSFVSGGREFDFTKVKSALKNYPVEHKRVKSEKGKSKEEPGMDLDY
jgi:hypothetical protein